MALVSIEHSGTLEFSREFTKLADTVHRQFSLALSDCHFEGEICETFRPAFFPAMYLFKEGKVYLYN